MPPAAATECERTGWTLDTIATDAPPSAAASAARCPARPAPSTSTSYAGTHTCPELERHLTSCSARRVRVRPPPPLLMPVRQVRLTFLVAGRARASIGVSSP